VKFSRVFLEKLIVVRLVNYFQNSMEPCSENPATALYLEPVESNKVKVNDEVVPGLFS